MKAWRRTARSPGSLPTGPLTFEIEDDDHDLTVGALWQWTLADPITWLIQQRLNAAAWTDLVTLPGNARSTAQPSGGAPGDTVQWRVHGQDAWNAPTTQDSHSNVLTL